jgi:hypothetical protein
MFTVITFIFAPVMKHGHATKSNHIVGQRRQVMTVECEATCSPQGTTIKRDYVSGARPRRGDSALANRRLAARRQATARKRAAAKPAQTRKRATAKRRTTAKRSTAAKPATR